MSQQSITFPLCLSGMMSHDEAAQTVVWNRGLDLEAGDDIETENSPQEAVV